MITTSKRDRGDTLVEVLVAILIIGLTSAALLGAFSTAITGSAIQQGTSTVDTILNSYAAAASAEVETQPNFVSCATNSSYQLVAPYPSNASPGSTVGVFGTGFTAGKTITAKVGGASVTVASGANVSQSGSISATLDLPMAVATGPTTVTVSDGTHSGTGAFTVTSAPAPISTNLAQLGYSISIQSISYWNASEGAFGGIGFCDANGPQLITAQAVGPTGFKDQLSFVLSNPNFVSKGI